jgi:transcriptional regulator with XRE-family HTH domain
VPDEPLDIQALGRMLRERRQREGLSLRQAALQAEVPPATFSRVEEGRVPDLATYQRLVAWLGVSSDTFIQRRYVRLESTPQIIAEHLQADKNLRPEAAKHIAEIVEDLYRALQSHDDHALAMHLRAAKTFRPDAMDLLGDLLSSMQASLMQSQID